MAPTPDLARGGRQHLPGPRRLLLAGLSFIWAFAINSWERQTHLLPVSYQLFAGHEHGRRG